jgi:hypothetical protein
MAAAARDPLSGRAEHDRLAGSCTCGAPRPQETPGPNRVISSHRTSLGHVVYYRCDCGRPLVTLVRRWSLRHSVRAGGDRGGRFNVG